MRLSPEPRSAPDQPLPARPPPPAGTCTLASTPISHQVPRPHLGPRSPPCSPCLQLGSNSFVERGGDQGTVGSLSTFLTVLCSLTWGRCPCPPGGRGHQAASTALPPSPSAFSPNTRLRKPCRHSRHLTGYKLRTARAPQLPPGRPRGSPASRTRPPGRPREPSPEHEHRARSALGPAGTAQRETGRNPGLKRFSREHVGLLSGACWGKRHSGFLTLVNWHLRIEILQM